jgi:hypothetical protein
MLSFFKELWYSLFPRKDINDITQSEEYKAMLEHRNK